MFTRAALLLPLVAAYVQPGDPPQCFEDYQCNFHRFPSDTGLPVEYSWDVFNLCASAGNEYVAAIDPGCTSANGTCLCNSCDPNARLRFNVCGTVAGPIAPVAESGSSSPPGVGDPQQLPLPHSHGVALQYIEGYPGPTPPAGYGPVGGCADVDTCDQGYNPTCVPGSQNYPQGVNQDDSFYTRRADRCADQGADYCSPYSYWCCSVKSTPCTKSAEVLAYYDGSPPNFNLFNEGSPDGLTLNYYGALPYINDPFPCSASTVVDPSTGIAPTRTVTIALLCDRSVASGLQNIRFREVSACNYLIIASTKYACGTANDDGSPSNTPSGTSSPSALPSVTPSTTGTLTSTSSDSSSPTPSHAPWVPAAQASAAAAAAAAAASAADDKAAKAATAAASARAGAGAGGFFGGLAAGALGAVLFSMWRAGSLTSAVNKAMYGEKTPLMLSPKAAGSGFSPA